ncbi:hypothetical protein BKA70DRAFT_1260400 [Coprinopsis sp. MPI-PUGE-AT-0042]|nr:hypothetical protein BKA70DRAFT_1260400 [Coprinopsis sp. MPI-PUGE-AT-0042]
MTSPSVHPLKVESVAHSSCNLISFSTSTMANTVTVTGLAPTTTQSKLNEFFSFCGQINSIEQDADSRKATINFAKASAAKTALMLNGGTLDGATLSVTSDVAHQDDDHHHTEGETVQEDKPRAAIAAEYLAKGYTLSDQILARAIELDQQKGISAKFLNYVQQIDKTVGEKALGPDQTVSGKVQGVVKDAHHQAEQKGYIQQFYDYYAKVISTPFGQTVRNFYTTTSKQIADIHEEAKRIAAEEKDKHPTSTTSPSTSQPNPSAAAPPVTVV